MKTRHIIIVLAALVASFTPSGASAWDQDPFAMYINRGDTVTLGAGNARDVNAATHVIDPWPRYVGNRNIPGNGERLGCAVERYRQGSYKSPAIPLIPSYGTTIGVTGGAVGGGAQGAGGVQSRPPNC